jgi:hypothetical protein
MKASELIVLLQDAIDKYGDVEIFAYDEQDEDGKDAHLFQLGWKLSKPNRPKPEMIYLYPTWYN